MFQYRPVGLWETQRQSIPSLGNGLRRQTGYRVLREDDFPNVLALVGLRFGKLLTALGKQLNSFTRTEVNDSERITSF